MRIAVTGGLGFVGRSLIPRLIKEGHDVTVFDNSDESTFNYEGACYVKSDLRVPGSWQNFICKQDAIINLAGVNIFQRWNDARKKEIYESRVLSTSNIVSALAQDDNQCKLLINASAVGYYGFRKDEEIDETASGGDDFLSYVCKNWENEAERATGSGVRVIVLRFGSVLGKDGGAFPELKRTFKRFMGAKLGSGRQWFPWIHIEDLLGIIFISMLRSDMSGPYNCVSPETVTNAEFTRTLRKNIGRISFLPFVPGFVLRIVLGEFGSYLVKGQRAVPVKLKELGYRFRYGNLDSALNSLL